MLSNLVGLFRYQTKCETPIPPKTTLPQFADAFYHLLRFVSRGICILCILVIYGNQERREHSATPHPASHSGIQTCITAHNLTQLHSASSSIIQTHIASHSLMQHQPALCRLAQPHISPYILIQITCAHPASHQPKPFLFGRVVTGVTGVWNEYPLYTPEAYVASTLAYHERVQ